MRGLGILLMMVFLLTLGAAPQEEDIEIQGIDDVEFRLYRNEALKAGDILRTYGEGIEFTYPDGNTIWVGPDTDLLYSSPNSVSLLEGEVEAVLGEEADPDEKILIVLGSYRALVERGGVGAAYFPDEEEVQVDSLDTHEIVDILVEAPSTGFRLSLLEEQRVILFYDEKNRSTQVRVPEETEKDVEVKLLDNEVTIVTGDLTQQELFVGLNQIWIPPGCEVIIHEAPGGAKGFEPTRVGPEAVPVTEGELRIPEDEPFEDSGDILEVINVSPSQPR